MKKKQIKYLVVLILALGVAVNALRVRGEYISFENLMTEMGFAGQVVLPTRPTIPSITPTERTVSGVATQSGLIRVVKIIDGDTIQIEGGQKLRYIGIDTPETKHPSKGLECFGREAMERNRQLVEGKEVRLEKDVSETDRYGRLLRYVYIDGQMINEQLVREGYAHASSYPPDVKYQDTLRSAEKLAREEGKGFWKECE